MRATGLFWLAIAAFACQKPADKAPGGRDATAAAHVDEAPHPAFPRRIRLRPEVEREAGIRVQTATLGTLPDLLRLPGEIVADPDKSAIVSSPVAGRIEAVLFHEGSVIKRGQALLRLRVPDLGRLRGAYAAAASRAKAARTNADRLKRLRDDKLTSDQTYLDAEAQAKALAAEVDAFSEQLQAIGAGDGPSSEVELTIRAAMNGTVVRRGVVIGQPITPEQSLASVADLSEVWFLARAFEKDLSRLRLHDAADVQLNAYPQERFAGVVEYIAEQLDPTSRTITARIRLSNRQGLLRIGLFGNATVAVASASSSAASGGTQAPEALLLPRSALSELGGQIVVFVRQKDGDFDVHEVVLGRSALGKVEVLSGLRAGEQVVVDGAFTLRSAVLRHTLSDEH